MSDDNKDSEYSIPSSSDSTPKPKRLDRAAQKLMPATAISYANSPKLPSDAPFKLKLKHFLYEKITRKEYVIGGIVFVILFGSAVAFGLASFVSSPNQPTSPTVKAKPVSAVIYSPLTGEPVTASDAKRPVTGVMIENTDFARPQSGLKQAGVIFEAIAEAGITRFLALYQESKPTNIGPIRSVRPYYLTWDMGFDAPIAHVGGSPQALADVIAWHAKDIGEFTYGGYYHRISSREAPHNMYTSMADLNAIEKLNHWTSSNFVGFPRKPDSPSKTPDATSINMDISYADFNVRYAYDSTQNSYLRWEGGAPHIDATTGKQLEPKVVIAMIVPYSLGPLDTSGAYYSEYATIGTGKVYVFQDGTVTIGIWQKTSRTSQIHFMDANNKPIRLNAGQTWITSLGSASQLSYKS
jgi:hypothetical protein